MKKTLATLTVIAGLALTSYGQGYIFFDSSTGPAGLVSINGVLDIATDVNATLVNSTTGTTIATLLLSVPPSDLGGSAIGDITAYNTGQLFDNSGLSYAASAAGGTFNFVVQAWLGNFSSYADAQAAGNTVGGATFGATAPFSALTIEAPATPGGLDSMGALNLTFVNAVPEPSTLVLAGIGAALLVIRRRK
jgi:hypothetical protein